MFCRVRRKPWSEIFLELRARARSARFDSVPKFLRSGWVRSARILVSFRGLNPKAFDGHGNYSLGLTEQLVFPEINPDKFTHIQGMNVTIVTTADSDEEARTLLKGFGLPLKSMDDTDDDSN